MNRCKSDTENCDGRYVKWVWMVGIVVTLISVISVASYSTGSWKATVESRLESVETKVAKLDRIEDNTDTIKVMLSLLGAK